jgi:hypothetical protein
MVIVGREDEANRVRALLNDTQAQAPDCLDLSTPQRPRRMQAIPRRPCTWGTLNRSMRSSPSHRVDEIVFCSKDLPSRRIIRIMSRLIGTSVDFKIAPPESMSVIGSNSSNTAGDLYTIHVNSIGKPANRRSKRLFDAASALLLLLTFPLWFLFVRGHFKSVVNTFLVLVGKRTWVGYLESDHPDPPELPKLKKGVLNPGIHLSEETLTPERITEINVVYSQRLSHLPRSVNNRPEFQKDIKEFLTKFSKIA